MTVAWTDRPAQAAAVLAAGGVVLLPTDTLPGLHARLDRPAAVARLRQLKEREPDRPLLLLCASVTEALELAGTRDRRVAAYARRCWPGPFTLVLPVAPAVSRVVHPAGGTAGLRVPAPVVLRRFLARVGTPLVSTSANRSGESPSRTLDEAADRLGRGVDLVLDLPLTGAGAASAVVDLTAWPPRLQRAGPRPLPEP